MVRGLMALAATAAVVCGTGRADAAVTAEFDIFGSGGDWYIQPLYDDYRVMQTFTATVAGTVESVDVAVNHTDQRAGVPTNPDGEPLTAAIYALEPSDFNGLQPTGAPLATGAIAPDDAQFDAIFISWKNIAMSGGELEAGTMYGLVLSAGTSSNAYEWYSKFTPGTDLYTGGNLAIAVGGPGSTFGHDPSDDVSFRVNVAVPEPASLGLLAVAGLALVGRRGAGR